MMVEVKVVVVEVVVGFSCGACILVVVDVVVVVGYCCGGGFVGGGRGCVVVRMISVI